MVGYVSICTILYFWKIVHLMLSVCAQNRSDSDTNSTPESLFVESVSDFDDRCSRVQHSFCEVCKRVSMNLLVRTNRISGLATCVSCTVSKRTQKDFEKILPVWTDDKGATRYDLPSELVDLTQAEKLLISPFLVYVPLHHMKQGQVGCKGHVCCFEQDVASMSYVLPRLPRDINLIRVIKKYKEDDGQISSKTFNVRRKKVQDALRWLKQYSLAFEDVDIDFSRMDWMKDSEEDILPAIKTTTVECSDENNEEDNGPATHQVSTVLEKEEYHEEIFGTQQMNNTGAKMSPDNSDVNKQLANAFKQRYGSIFGFRIQIIILSPLLVFQLFVMVVT